ncbi:MAG TPA: hypothetical protein VJ919_00365 [Tangfeifania sp.]|nr:hypothetical protein [Tangfeifania sp.]
MSYTVKIDASNPKARSIVNMLKELSEDYTFIQIHEDEQELSNDMVKELEARYQHAIKNPEEGKSWEEVKANLKK